MTDPSPPEIKSQSFSTDLSSREDGVRLIETNETFEWWYFDNVFNDGSTCVVSFLNKRPFFFPGPLSPILQLNISTPGDPLAVAKQFPQPPMSWQTATDHCDVRCQDGSVGGDLHTYRLRVQPRATDILVDLTLSRVVPSFRVGPFKPPAVCADEWLGEQIIIPAGTVEGTIAFGGKSHVVSGSCYHDHQWGKAAPPPPHPPAISWYWGRAHVGDYAVVFAQILVEEEPVNVMFFLSRDNGATVMYSDVVSELTIKRLLTGGPMPGLTVRWSDLLRNEVDLTYKPGELIGEFGSPPQKYKRYLSPMTLRSRIDGKEFVSREVPMIWEENTFG